MLHDSTVATNVHGPILPNSNHASTTNAAIISVSPSHNTEEDEAQTKKPQVRCLSGECYLTPEGTRTPLLQHAFPIPL
jgi:hypothetical protein